MRKSHLLFLIIPTAFVLSTALKSGPSEQEKYAQTITASDLRTHLNILASDEYEGRETGERGQKMAAEYIANFYKTIGIPPQQDGSWFQYVNLVKISGGSSKFDCSGTNTSDIHFDASEDYYYTSRTPSVSVSCKKVLFAGFGIDDSKYSDFTGDSADYSGQVVMILDGEPMNNGVYTITGDKSPGMWTKQRRAKMNAAKARNISVLLVVPVDYDKSKEAAQHNIEGYSLQLDEPYVTEEQQTTVIYISPSMANQILSAGGNVNTVEQLRTSINSSGKTTALTVSSTCMTSITRKEEKIQSENVLGFVEGTDLKQEVIVVTAHYDHLGKHDGVVYNGADDDGSGTVAVMEIAEAFMKAKQDGRGPRRSMLFMNVTGEEKGLLGSSWYTKHPVYPLKNTMCDLNIDMIGRADEEHAKDSNFVYVIGSDKISSDLKKVIEASNKRHTKLKLDYRFDDDKDPNMFYYRSDHYNFAKNGIPVAFFFNGVHADYHKETDEVSRINFNLMERRTRLVFYAAWDLANKTKELKPNKKK